MKGINDIIIEILPPQGISLQVTRPYEVLDRLTLYGCQLLRKRVGVFTSQAIAIDIFNPATKIRT